MKLDKRGSVIAIMFFTVIFLTAIALFDTGVDVDKNEIIITFWEQLMGAVDGF